VPHLVRHYGMPLFARAQVRKDNTRPTLHGFLESWSTNRLFALPAAIRLVLVMCFRAAKSANLVLQSRTFQSEPFGASALSGNPPRSSSQCLNDHTAFRLSKA